MAWNTETKLLRPLFKGNFCEQSWNILWPLFELPVRSQRSVQDIWQFAERRICLVKCVSVKSRVARKSRLMSADFPLTHFSRICSSLSQPTRRSRRKMNNKMAIKPQIDWYANLSNYCDGIFLKCLSKMVHSIKSYSLEWRAIKSRAYGALWILYQSILFHINEI